MRATIIAGQYMQDQEFIYPFYRLKEAGFEVSVWTPDGQDCTGFAGTKIVSSHCQLDHGANLVVLPGGVKAMEHLRLRDDLLMYIRHRHEFGAVIASICSGAQLLISAKIVKGKLISGYYAMRDDIENAGATFVDAPSVVSERIVTSPHYRYLGDWMHAVLIEVKKQNHA